MSSRDANYATEAQNIISMINNMSGKYNEVKQVLETYYNNFTRIATDFESISRIITSLHRFRAKWDIVWDSLKCLGYGKWTTLSERRQWHPSRSNLTIIIINGIH